MDSYVLACLGVIGAIIVAVLFFRRGRGPNTHEKPDESESPGDRE